MKNCVLCLMGFTGFLIHIFHCQLHHESHLPVKRFRRFLTPVRKNRCSFLARDQIDKTFSSEIYKCVVIVFQLRNNCYTCTLHLYTEVFFNQLRYTQGGRRMISFATSDYLFI